jgi:ribosomal protein S4
MPGREGEAMSNRPTSKDAREERKARSKLAEITEEWHILQMELAALLELMKTSYANSAQIPEEAQAAIIQGLERRLEKMKTVA